jgi:hypothetical protein
MPTRSTIRYAAKQAYQLALMRGIYHSTHVGLECDVFAQEGYVYVTRDSLTFWEVPIAKAWSNL